MRKRTSKDEQLFDESLRREESTKTEVILELRNENKRLLQNQQRTMAALIQTGDLLLQSLEALRIYRVQILQGTESALKSNSPCVPGCRTHHWDTEHGWRTRSDGDAS